MEVFWKILHKFYTDNPCFPILEKLCKHTLNLFSSNIWVFSGKYDDPVHSYVWEIFYFWQIIEYITHLKFLKNDAHVLITIAYWKYRGQDDKGI